MNREKTHPLVEHKEQSDSFSFDISTVDQNINLPRQNEPRGLRGSKLSRRQFLSGLLGLAGVSLADLLLKPDGRVEAQDQQVRLIDRQFAAGSLHIEAGEASGQAYIETRFENDQRLYRIVTIGHVVDFGASQRQDQPVRITIDLPGRAGALSINARSRDFQPETANTNDPDQAVHIEITATDHPQIYEYIDGENQRDRVPQIARVRPNQGQLDDLVGLHLASPRPDTGRWTIYQVIDINFETNQLITQAVYGNHCEGRSGAPMLLVDSYEDGSLSLFSYENKAICFGEVEGPSQNTRDFVEASTGLYCAEFIRVNMPKRA